MNRYKTDILKTYYMIFFDTNCNWCHFEKISNYIGFVYCFQIDTDFLPIAPIFDRWKKYQQFFIPMFSRTQNVTVSLHILPILDHWKARLWMLNRLKSEIMNVESVKKWYYKCWISWKAILRMLNQFKVMENEYIGIMPICWYETDTKWKISD